MTKLTKNGLVMSALDDVQVSAFLNSGWTIVEEQPQKVEETTEKKTTTKKTNKTDK